MRSPDPGAVTELAGDWLRVVAAAGFVPGVRARARAALNDLLDELIAAVRAEPFDPLPGYRIGAELVDLRMSAPPVIGTTVHLLTDRLPVLLGEGSRDRLLPLLEQVTTGFVSAQRDAAVRAAEEMNRSEKIHWRSVQVDLQRRLQQALLHRPDTGLPNEQHLREHLTELVAAGEPARLGVCLLSLDGYADLTDALGHDNGVRLLADVAGRLRTLGHFLAHLGDAEFALVIAGTTGPDDLVK
ncbi:MAG: GGDEF domain-containing protein, partial [Actinoplanes sp.]